jgi:hypothetical protein
MKVVDLADQPEKILEDAARLLVEEFDAWHGWPTLALAVDEVRSVISDGFARAMIENDFLFGWIGGLPEYHGRVWELHSLVVRREHRRASCRNASVGENVQRDNRQDGSRSQRRRRDA